MKVYTKQQTKKLQARNWAATIGSSTNIIRAFSKDNAVRRFQEMSNNITDSDVYAYDGAIGGSPIDCITETAPGEYEIKFVSEVYPG